MNKIPSYRVAIQGIAGAFHEIAARKYFNGSPLEIIPSNTFEQLIEKTGNATECDAGIIAIENSIAGSILNNYNLIHQSKHQITGEVHIRIKQNLMVLPGTSINDLKEVHSHHMAIAQCRKYFKNYPHIKLIEAEDTALSAQMIREKGLVHTGAIASTLAAEMYALDIIGEGIEDNPTNATRFLILEDQKKGKINNTSGNKISLCFTLSHEIGSLHKVLAYLAQIKANLTKIQSVPIMDKQWQYRFFLDFILDDNNQYEALITQLNTLSNNLIILGRYNKGNHYDN